MTSNIGSQWISELGAGDYDEMKKRVNEAVKLHFKPEFLNRIDEIIMFKPFTQDEIRTVVELQVGIIQKMLAKNDIRLMATKKAILFIATLGFDPQFGARPIKRVIQKNLLNELSKMILEGKVNKDKEILVDEKEGKMLFRNT